MAKKLSSVLGIDIGSQTIKVAEIRTTGREPSISALGMTATPEGAVDHTGIFNPDAVAGALKALISECGATVNQAVVSIAGQASVLVRTLEVPRMNDDELKEHMQWEINRNIPFAESTVVSDFRKLPEEDPGSANVDVVMAISPQSAIDTIVQAVKKSGRSLAAIDVEPLAIGRCLELCYGDVLGTDPVCVVDMGAKTTAINVYSGGKILMPRQVPIGGDAITSAIAQAMGMSSAEAEQLKQARASIPESAANASGMGGATGGFQPFNPFADETSAFVPPGFEAAPEPSAPASADPLPVPSEDAETMRLFNSFSGVLDEFTGEVRRSIDYFRSRGGDVRRVMLAGGAAKIPGMAQYLSKSLGIECDAFDPTRRLNINVRKVAPGFIDEHKQEFVVAIGNGLHIFFD